MTATDFQAFVFPVIALMLGLFLDEVNKRVSFLGIPDSVLQFLMAMFMSIAIYKFLPADVVKGIAAKYSWTSLQPETLLMVMLPPLLFESSFKINSHLFLSKLNLVICLTVVAYFVTLFVASAIMLPVLVQTQNLKISAVFLFVSIIVATDPVAVVAILEQNGAPHRLRILIEGESLLNDGLALTTYRVLEGLLWYELGRTDHFNIWRQLFDLVMNIIVSPAMGAIAARGVAWIVSKLQENKKRQAFILVSVYGIFMVCEFCSGSPALGLVSFGIMLNFYRETFAPETTEMALELWATMGYWANNVIFIFAGFSVGSEMFTHGPQIDSNEVSYMETDIEDMMTLVGGILIAPIPLFARIASVFFFYKFYAIFSTQPIPSRREFTILAYAGLRGALGLILAMELRHKLGGFLTKKVLLLTCSTTFVCLVFQGMTFSTLARKEGSTKRSKYVKDSCVRLCRYLDVKVREAVRAMELDQSPYLTGANWNVVRAQTMECLSKHSAQMENEMLLQQDEFVGDTSDEEVVEKERDGEIVDTRIGFYGILLARVQDSWSRGALPGATAHIIVAILEHGIDEGKITADDIEHHLEMVQPNFEDAIVFTVSNWLYKWISHESFLNKFAQIGDRPLLAPKRTSAVQYVTSRPFEKWWIFQTLIMCIYSILIAHVNFDEVGHVLRAVVYLCCIAIWAMNITQTIYIIHKCAKVTQPSSDGKSYSPGQDPPKQIRIKWRDRIRSRHFLPTIIACAIVSTAFVLSLIILNKGRCIRGDESNSYQCQGLRLSTFILIIIFTLYKITRATPSFVIMLREYSIERQLMLARIRLAVFHYLHHLVSEIKISPDLFSLSAFKVARREAASFDKVVDGLMRLELKENTADIDVIAAIKTRQAVRMMSFQLKMLLNFLRIEGFMPDDTKEKWHEVVTELRDSADAILWVPQLSFVDCLQSVKWIRSLRESSKQKVTDLLNKALCSAQLRKFSCGTRIKTGGRTMWFLVKGVCKVTEWVPLQKTRYYHEFHAGQGMFLGERNILMRKWTGKLLPLMWPKRRYETTTYCEMVEINEDAIKEMITIEPSIYSLISNDLQADGLMTELRHMRGKKHETTAANFWTSFQRCGKSLSKPEQLTVPEGRIGLVGCWTQITLVAPQTALDSKLHIRGPAKLWVEPADSRAPGMVYFEKIRYDESFETAGEVSSCVSFVHEGPERKLRQLSAEERHRSIA